MKIDDLIEQLNALRAQHHNLEIVLQEQTVGELFYRNPKVRFEIVYGLNFQRNFAARPNKEDVAKPVVVLSIKP